MMIKLYKKEGDLLHYWEAWDTDGQVVIHCGIVGSEGTTREVNCSPGHDLSSTIEAEASRVRTKGYCEIDKLQCIVIRYRIVDMGTTTDLEKRYEVESSISQRLGWTGLGHCDGGDIGSDSMNIFCYVVDADKGAQVIIDELKARNHSAGAKVILISDEDEELLLFPKGSLERVQ